MTTTLNLRNLDYAVALAAINPADFHRRPAVFTEIAPDFEVLIQVVIRPYIDPGCVSLSEEELAAECRFKLANILNARKDQSIPNRVEFFKYLKTALNNHVKGQVQRHRFTLKRTGIKPPAKGDFLAEHRKPTEISLDDPDSFLQVPEALVEDGIHGELAEDIKSQLTSLERLVFEQLLEPNQHATLEALMDVWSGKNASTKVTVHHLAAGLGMPVDQFLTIRKQLQAKLKRIMPQNEDYAWNASVAFLAQTFNVEVPRSIEPVIVRRLFCLASRVYAHRLSPEIKHHLGVIKAVVPQETSVGLDCFGIMFEDHDTKCRGCGVKSACAVQTRSVGLDKITPHPSVLGKSVKTPHVLPEAQEEPAQEESPVATSAPVTLPSVPEETPENVEQPQRVQLAVQQVSPAVASTILSAEVGLSLESFLSSHFKRTEKETEGDPGGKTISFTFSNTNISPILWLTATVGGQYRLRFTKPSKAIEAHLVIAKSGGRYVPNTLPMEEIIALITAFSTEKSHERNIATSQA
jgi:hypothetical protein